MEHYKAQRQSLGPNDAMTSRTAGQVYDPAIMAFRPQRFSLASSRSSVSWDSVSFDPDSRPSSASSYVSFGLGPSSNSSVQANPPSVGSQRSSYATQQKLRLINPPPPVFQRLPLEIYTCILQQLRLFHDEPLSLSCETCYLRDLCTLALTSRAWDRAVRIQLYNRIHIVGHDSPLHIKKFKMKYGVRLKLLRRTLRERRVLAQYVHELKVPNLSLEPGRKGREIVDLVASVVMACPNLEKLVGFYPVYHHEFDRLTHALSTRSKLKEHTWIIGDNQAITQRSHKQLPPGLMDEKQVNGFLQYHDAWSTLNTMFLHSHSQGILEPGVFLEMFSRLPALQHLCVSNFDVDDFDDVTLKAIPPLQSLRLQELAGITFQGLSNFARAPNAQGIQHLSLINLDIKYLSAISKLLLNLTQLTRFTLVQESPPEVASGELVFQPIVASPQLEFLHWDILLPGSANENLANSIRAHGFPSLRTLRAPSDHGGLLQAICKPRAQILLASDKYSSVQAHDPAHNQFSEVRTLFAARKAAQERIEEARKTVQFQVIVEEDGVLRQIYDFNGFVGTVGSKITYSLKPDVLGSDGAVIDFLNLMDVSKEATVKDGCKGLWNASHPAGKPWWSHTERFRYRPIHLQQFF